MKKFFWIEKVQSPTYIHYKKLSEDIYHFDLYRLSSYEEFVNIWWEEILDSKQNTCFIEWPDLLEWKYEPDVIIRLDKTDNENERKIEVIYSS